MKHKKIPTIVLIILAVPVTVGLMIGFVAWRISVMANSQIEDINGDSKELAVITDEDIEAHEYGCVTYMSGWSTTGSKASGVQGDYEEYDNENSRFTAKKMSGIGTVNAYLGNGADVTYVFESTVSRGNFRIVITDEDGKIIQTVPIDQKATVTISTQADKLYFVKYVGESAEIQVEMWRTADGKGDNQ